MVDYTKVLVVDDDDHIRKLFQIYFKNQFEMEFAETGREALDKAINDDFDLIILDLMLPELSGYEVLEELRKVKETPVVMLSARGEEVDKIIGLKQGADDYVTKPFSPKELEARVEAILRRAGKQNQLLDGSKIKINGLIIDKETFTIKSGDVSINLTAKEFDILWLLASNRGRVFNRDHLIEAIWGYNYLGETRAIDAHIKRIRKKLEELGFADYLQTARGIGYKFEV